jgi:hypothetical protein
VSGFVYTIKRGLVVVGFPSLNLVCALNTSKKSAGAGSKQLVSVLLRLPWCVESLCVTIMNATMWLLA